MSSSIAIARMLGEKIKEFGASNGIRIAYENTSLKPEPTEIWIGESIVPILRKPLTVDQGGMILNIGIYDLTINVPINSTKFKALNIAGLLSEFMKAGTMLSADVSAKSYQARVMSIYTGRGFVLNNFYVVPVAIEYKMLSND